MANINLRVGNDALTFAEVDSNFTNLNNESFYGGITFTSGIMKFQPIGSDGTGGSDPYPPIEFNLDNTYLNQSSATILRPGKFEVPDGNFIPNATNWATPAAKIQILKSENFLVNAIQTNGHQSTFGESDSYFATFYGETDGQRTKDYSPSDVSFSTSGGTTLTINELDTRPSVSLTTAVGSIWSTHGIENFYILMSNLAETIIGGTITLFHDGSNESYVIDDITYTENADGVRESVVLDLTFKIGNGVNSGDTIDEIRFSSRAWTGTSYSYSSDYHLTAPKAPLTQPMGAGFGYLQDSNLGVGRLMAVNSFWRPDGSDTTLRYADSDDILVGGVTTSTDLLSVKPQLRTPSASSKIIEGSYLVEDEGRQVLISGGDTHHSSGNHSGGTLELRSGANTHYADDNNNYFTDSISNRSSEYGGMTDNVNSLIKLDGQELGSNSTTHNSVVISAGRNIKDGSNDRNGAGIAIMLGGGTGTGSPGGFQIRLFDPPLSTQTSSDTIPAGSNTTTPFKIEWDSANHEYKTTISKLDAVLELELAELNFNATVANHPFDLNDDAIISTTDAGIFQDFVRGDEIPSSIGINIEEATIIKGSTKSTYDTSITNDNVYDYPTTVSNIVPRLMMFSGSSMDIMNASTNNDRSGGDLIILGHTQQKQGGAVSFHNGLAIDGDRFSLRNSSGNGVEISENGNFLTVSHGSSITVSSTSVTTDNDLNVTGDINASGDVSAFSDESIKENVEVIEDAVDKVQQLNGYTFDRTDIETSRQTGVIAQEVLKVLPEAVGEKDGLHTVAYGNMVGLLIEAIKEQQGQIDSLKEELQSIKSINK